MCGIAGTWLTERRMSGAPGSVAAAMSAPIAHRGPDDDGVWADGTGLELGFRRLAIFDTSPLGHQPMLSATERFVMVFNGEVYNHPELRSELEAGGARFRSGSDTEVILAGFEAWGVPATLRRCRGMWGIGLWDRQERTLSLARDRLGIKPLYLYRSQGILAFASEMRCFREIPSAPLTVDRHAAASFLSLLSVPAPHSIFEEVTKVGPGTVVTFAGPDTDPTVETYWSLGDAVAGGLANPLTGTDEELVEAVAEEIRASVELRLRADVPVGAFLSGGVDSSTVVAVAQSMLGRPLRTFTIGFEDPRFDESVVAREIAGRLGTEHTEVVVTERELLDAVSTLPDVFDEPFADPSQLPTQIISAVARRDVTVSLSGDGGDEIFAGYNRYLRGAPMLGFADARSEATRRALGTALGLVPVGLLEGNPLGRRLLRRLGASEQHPLAARVDKLRGVLTADSMEARYLELMSVNRDVPGLLPERAYAPPGIARGLASRGPSLLRRLMLADQGAYLQDDLLTKLDRNSMSVALEARVPLLDHRLLELSWRLPDRMLVREGRGKHVLRQVLGRHLPPELIDRPKMGFSVPVSGWLRGPLKEWASDLLSGDAVGRAGLLDPAAVGAIWKGFTRGEAVNPLAVWALTQLQAWSRRWGASS